MWQQAARTRAFEALRPTAAVLARARRARRRCFGGHGNEQDGLAGFNEVAIHKINGGDLAAVDLGSIRAVKIGQAAERWVDFDHEVEARKAGILEGQAELGPSRPAHDESLVLLELEFATLVGAFLDREFDRHELAYLHGD